MGVLIYIRQFSCTFSTLEYFSAACAAQRSRSVQPLHIHSGSCAPFSQGFRALVTDCAQALRPVSGISGFLKKCSGGFCPIKKARRIKAALDRLNETNVIQRDEEGGTARRDCRWTKTHRHRYRNGWARAAQRQYLQRSH